MKFRVDICRIGYRHAVIEVEADDEIEAQGKAIVEAPNHEFPTEYCSEYEAIGSEEAE